ncbi:MAG: hypothetical protein HON62_11715, partial [Rhodospirillaceae bacterium]|nr:hypothetical protein [Rhodospirillaceae bacterium]
MASPLPGLAAGSVVAGYMPMRSEIDPRLLMDRLAAAGAVLCWWQIRDVTWRVTPGLHSADDVLSAMPKHAFHAGATSWAMPKRHDSDSDE